MCSGFIGKEKKWIGKKNCSTDLFGNAQVINILVELVSITVCSFLSVNCKPIKLARNAYDD